MISHTDALKRLAQCRENQRDELQVVVSADIVDALLNDTFDTLLEAARAYLDTHYPRSLVSLPFDDSQDPGIRLVKALRDCLEREVCQFCKGRPVSDAASWRDGKPRPPLPCPRCGEVYEEAS